MKLNLGCGNTLLKDYYNFDKYGYTVKDWNIEDLNYNNIFYIDLDKIPLIFKNLSIKNINLNQVLEHLNINPLDIMKEFYRILKEGEIIKIGLPVNSPFIYHVRSRHTKAYFKPITENGFNCNEKYSVGYWKCKKINYKFASIKTILSRILEFIRGFIYQDVCFELKK